LPTSFETSAASSSVAIENSGVHTCAGGATFQQRAAFSTGERVKTLRHNALCVLVGPANVKFCQRAENAAGGKREN